MKKTSIQRSPAFYGGAGYALLCFGKSQRQQFSIAVAADVLAGKFRNTSDARTTAKKLEKHGLLKNIDRDIWLLTDDGYEAIDKIVNNYRKMRIRLLGKGYVENKLKEIRINSSKSANGFMDDEILEEIYIKTLTTSKKQSAAKKRRGV